MEDILRRIAGCPPRQRSGRRTSGALRRRHGLLAGLVPLLGGFLSVTMLGQMTVGEQAFAAAAAALRDPSSVLASRSPGKRAAGPLMSSKPARPGAAREAGWGAPPAPAAFAAEATPPPPSLLPLDEPALPDPAAYLAQAIPPLEAVSVPGQGDAIPLPGGGGYIPTPFPWWPWGPPRVDNPPTVIPTIPEPSTWLLAIMGFLAAGAAMRRRPAMSVMRQD